MKPFFLLAFILSALTTHAQTFTCGKSESGSVQLAANSIYAASTPGFDLGTTPTVAANSCSSDRPFFFSVALPEGGYRVKVTFGGDQPSTTTVWAEARRLMIEKVSVKANGSSTRTFDTNIRIPQIGGDPSHLVKLKPREVGNLDWDNKLTLEFNGDHPSVRSISIEPIHETTIYLAGDSTVVDQDIEPWAAWGQMLPRFFRPGVVIANHAESGETIRSFVTEQRFAKVMSLIQPGDYLFIQFGHNDQKPGAVSLDDYKKYLLDYVQQTRAKGATPVIVTSMNRRTFDDAGKITNSLSGYPDAMREVAAAQHVALIDLNAMSKTLFETMGPEGTLKAFMHYAANTFPNQTEAINDNTHFNKYGAYELARCVVDGIRADKLPVAKLLDKHVPRFDPAKPDSEVAVSLPFTPIPPKDLSSLTEYGVNGGRTTPGAAATQTQAGPSATAATQSTPPTTDPGVHAPIVLPVPKNPDLPTLYLVGDSTVRNGRGDGGGGQWGWGEPLVDFFDAAKINVVNRALGGRSSRTYITEGRWDQVLAMLKPGDFVIFQFGHNDSGPLDDTSRARGTIPGVGDETREIDNPITKKHEVVHTYGWYMRKYVEDTLAKGATPIICSPIPRKIWENGKVVRNAANYGGWAHQVAESEKVASIDLNEIIARRYDALGQEKVEPLFADPHTHTSRAGAELNAECVVAGLKSLSGDPLSKFLSDKGRAVEPDSGH